MFPGASVRALRPGLLSGLIAGTLLVAGCGSGAQPAAPRGVDPVLAARSTDPADSAETGAPVQAAGALPAPEAPVGADGTRRVIVGLDVDFVPEGRLPGPAAIQAQRDTIARAQDALLKRARDAITEVHARYRTIPFVAVRTDAAGAEALRLDAGVSSVRPDHLWRLTLAESTPLIGAPDAWSDGATGQGTVLAVLDTGIDKTHPFLAGKVVAEACFSSTDPLYGLISLCPGGVSRSTAPDSGVACSAQIDGCAHGTHVAGIAAGHGTDSSGVARDAELISIQVFGKGTQASCYPYRTCVGSIESDEILAMEHVLSLAQGGLQVAAVNLSVGGGQYGAPCDGAMPGMKAAIDNLRSFGVATVIAAGNDGAAQKLAAPACLSSAISVGATTKADAVDTSYSNSASFLTLLAPGTDIRSSIPGGGDAVYSGTSMAAPHVAGAFAVLRSAVPSLTVDESLTALVGTGVPLEDPRNQLVKPRVQVDSALRTVDVATTSAPGFQPPGGDYVGPQVVTLTTSTDGASIRYTLDGSRPTATVGTELASGGTVQVDSNQTVTAVAYTPDGTTSAARTAVYTLHGEAPVITPPDGEYTTAQTVTLVSPTPTTTLRYTTDGTTPSSTRGRTAVSGDTVAVSANSTLRAVAVHPGWNDSPLTLSRYFFTGGLTVTLEPAAARAAGARWRRMDSASDGFESGALDRFDYQMSGDGAWALTPTDARYGTYALATPTLLESQSASVSVTVWCDGDPISFSRQVSSEEGYDLFTFLVDGVVEGEWSGEVPWSTVSVPVPSGEHTFTWTYTKDHLGSVGRDTAWIDQINFPGDAWRASGDTVRVQTATQRLAFSAVPGWITPAFQTVTTPTGVEATAVGTWAARTVVTPTFNPPPGTYSTGQDVTVGTTTPGATLRYTVDGSAPDGTSPVVSGPFPLVPGDTLTLRVIAQVPDWLDSAEASGAWTITGMVAAPTLDPAPGIYLSSQSLTLATSTPGAGIHYTLDGSPPTPTSPTYTGPVALPDGQAVEVRARAWLDGWTTSTVTIGRYTVGSPITLDWEDAARADDRVLAGTSATLVVAGGIGPFTATPAQNAAGVPAALTWPSARDLAFAAPALGAFAGAFPVVVTDTATGATARVDVRVPPRIDLSSSLLTSTARSAQVTVSGASPGDTVALRLVDASGAALDDPEISLPATASALPDDLLGNPATAVLAATPAEEVVKFHVEATVDGEAVVSGVVEVAAAPPGTVPPGGCGCASTGGDRGVAGIAALVGLALVRRRRAA